MDNEPLLANRMETGNCCADKPGTSLSGCGAPMAVNRSVLCSYAPFQTGLRFSTKARAPSLASELFRITFTISSRS